ncbi:putative meiosis protein [Podospora australis]|uniref:Meiosis protein n=1 Tax=Podospora australis TaxID=1536484 RepID=A0AAN6WW28_9PEZI|nr:putative meiosis protein [Podospora australis]
MAGPRDNTLNMESPHSSSAGADSYKHEGTPDTRLTSFSPDDSARSSKLMSSLNHTGPSNHTSNHPLFRVDSVERFGNVNTAADKDPFVSTSTALPTGSSDQKLSPTASSFRPPVTAPVVAHGSAPHCTSSSTHGHSTAQQPLTLSSNGISDKFSDEQEITRYINVFSSSLDATITDDEVREYLERLMNNLGYRFHGKSSYFTRDGRAYIFVTNIRDASMVRANIHLGRNDWLAEYISASEFDKLRSSNDKSLVNNDGHLEVVGWPKSQAVTVELIETVIRTLMEGEGEVRAFHRLTPPSGISVQIWVEFYDTEVALAAASKVNGRDFNGVHLTAVLAKPETLVSNLQHQNAVQSMTTDFQNLGLSKPAQTLGSSMVSRTFQAPIGLPVQHQQLAMYPVGYYTVPPSTPNRYMMDQTPTRSPGISQSMQSMSPMTPIGGGMPMMSPLYTQTPPATPMFHTEYTSPRSLQAYGRFDNRFNHRQNAMRVNRSPQYNTAGHHNHVDVNRIREGTDVRTTIMLRNIPNKVDQAMLKRIVDESSWGKYDFMYLRIDFANDCNVGYAFINFVDPLDIIDFVNARGNQRWNCFKSDKVAEISYATIQGKDCLVQKFRNSSVMLEAPHYRPKLYFTSNGPRPDLAGQEETFPEPDNQSKMKRSCENAEHVGLFTPNAGQHFRDEQRRRRSQYDRGTRLAALEEYDYEAHMQQPGLYHP